MWVGYKNYDHYYTVDSLNGVSSWYAEIVKTNPERVLVNQRTHEYIWNIPCCFDIETSSYKRYGVKKATMYLWGLNINGSSILGRTWSQFVDIIDILANNMHTDKNHLVIYIHNMGYEFQWMKKWFNWTEVFAVKERRPIHGVLDNGIEFKCSYILSNYALAYIGNKLIKKYFVKKDVGAVDYSLVRHSSTELTNTEMWYNVHDLQVVTSYIQEKIENEGGLDKIPLTNTGYVRQYCRDFCFTQNQVDEKIMKKLKARYHESMTSLQITSVCEYDQQHEAFGGGFTHTGAEWSGKTCYNVGSADKISSYPYQMCGKKFPMGRGIFIGDADFSDIDWLTNTGYCCLFTVRLVDVNPEFIYENYISSSKCQILSKDAVINNGRVASASELQVTITEQDWDIIKRCYSFDESQSKIYNLRIYSAGYLPRPLILSILHLYANKTSLKGVKHKETEYLVSKGMLNSTYGMAVTSIIRDLYEYSNCDDWLTTKADKASQLQQYNRSYNRFLFYAWGVWVTAHARHDLWEAIFEFGEDYVYTDTDSIKGINFESHKDFFTLANFEIACNLKAMCDYWQIDYNLCEPKTIKDEKKLLGAWEEEKGYRVFKAIGAKRYMYEQMDGLLNFTISGVNKRYGVPYLLTEFANGKYANLYKLAYNPSFDEEEQSEQAIKMIQELHSKGEIDYSYIFEIFNEGLYFPPNATGKQTLTYVDEDLVDQCTDYLGKTATIYEGSYIHMEPQGYYMEPTYAYKRYLEGFRDESL